MRRAGIASHASSRIGKPPTSVTTTATGPTSHVPSSDAETASAAATATSAIRATSAR